MEFISHLLLTSIAFLNGSRILFILSLLGTIYNINLYEFLKEAII